jgi:hypothetical protein
VRYRKSNIFVVRLCCDPCFSEMRPYRWANIIDTCLLQIKQKQHGC